MVFRPSRVAAWLLASVGLAAAAVGVPAMAPAAPGPSLIEAPQGLAWTSGEVARAGLPAATAVLERARQQQALGCSQHCALIDRVWRRLLPVLEQQLGDRAASMHLRLQVVRLDGIEAFATPDGSIFLGEPFVARQAADDAQLAFVLAHEAAHVLLEHERENLTAALALLPRNVPRTVDDVYVELAYNYALLKAIEPSLHQVEFAADEAGFQLAALAGYAPLQQLGFALDQAAQEEPRRGLASTHPTALARLQRLQQLLPLAQAVYRRGRQLQPGLPSSRGFSSIGP